ncbi:MAG: helix-hairpin-helix domain-containing protein [Candidatus Marsarchaeota archaeon]|nr:helix-hairpin-helix domain-containing protein [Candidatus Marsarchaeota archaeon]
MDAIRVIVDQRERNIALLKALRDYGIDANMDTLDIGDYLISDRLCVERKTVADFEKSIVDGRLFDQLDRIKNAYERPIVILEGSPEDFRFKHNVINGAIVSVYIRYGIPVITSNGPEDTASIILTMAKQEQNGYREPTKKNGKRAFSEQEYMENVIGNIPGIGPKLARLLLKHFGSIEVMSRADVKELRKVDKIGKKKAESIMRILGGHYE